MSTPTTYDLSYDNPCAAEGGCGSNPCADKVEYTARPQVFCSEVKTLGNMFVGPGQIFVGGSRYGPVLVQANNGSFIVLART